MRLGRRTKKGLLILAMATAAPAFMPTEAKAQSALDVQRFGRGGHGRHGAYRYEISLVREAIHASYDRRSRRPFMTARRNFRSLSYSVSRMRNRALSYRLSRLIKHTETYAINNFRAPVYRRQRILERNGREIIYLLRNAGYQRPGRGGGIGAPGRGGDGPGRGGPGRGGR